MPSTWAKPELIPISSSSIALTPSSIDGLSSPVMSEATKKFDEELSRIMKISACQNSDQSDAVTSGLSSPMTVNAATWKFEQEL